MGCDYSQYDSCKFTPLKEYNNEVSLYVTYVSTQI